MGPSGDRAAVDASVPIIVIPISHPPNPGESLTNTTLLKHEDTRHSQRWGSIS